MLKKELCSPLTPTTMEKNYFLSTLLKMYQFTTNFVVILTGFLVHNLYNFIQVLRDCGKLKITLLVNAEKYRFLVSPNFIDSNNFRQQFTKTRFLIQWITIFDFSSGIEKRIIEQICFIRRKSSINLAEPVVQRCCLYRLIPTTSKPNWAAVWLMTEKRDIYPTMWSSSSISLRFYTYRIPSAFSKYANYPVIKIF